jgi:hypothetical protein
MCEDVSKGGRRGTSTSRSVKTKFHGARMLSCQWLGEKIISNGARNGKIYHQPNYMYLHICNTHKQIANYLND